MEEEEEEEAAAAREDKRRRRGRRARSKAGRDIITAPRCIAFIQQTL